MHNASDTIILGISKKYEYEQQFYISVVNHVCAIQF